ncbi:hypothetical protein M404DRAFT_21969 [Pisolithus tinctorius Marx 270]|uniref:Uncharacterized protein n=1 Tax=Pisolithus tinctorius Marx 270 TaxID=870435 RepID=A0A0C3PL60_PISTI|nr:hypothetical protein M404DRAFT_21969 [Pisolithus tinctorius Marx 270]
MVDIWGSLTQQQLYDSIPAGTLPNSLRTWAQLGPAIYQLPCNVQDMIQEVARAKEEATMEHKRKGKEMRQERWCTKRQHKTDEATAKESGGKDVQERHEATAQYMQLPTAKQQQCCIAAFIDATNNEALVSAVCVICMQQLLHKEGDLFIIKDIPHVRRHLSPAMAHPAHQLWDGLLVDCTHRLPKYAMNNNLWLGDIPFTLQNLSFVESLLIARHYPWCYVFKLYPRDGSRSQNPHHLQWAMAGNVTLYEINVPAIVDMLEGRLLPQTVEMLSSILAITMVGTKQLPKDWLSRTFRVHREVVQDALKWLQANNENYSDIMISDQHIFMLLEDGIPAEIEATIRYQDSEDTALREREGYSMNEDLVIDGERTILNNCVANGVEICPTTEMEGESDLPMVDVERDETWELNEGDGELASENTGDVTPIHVLGVADLEQTKVSSSELMAQALANFNDNTAEGGYVVCHGNAPIDDFPASPWSPATRNPLSTAFPVLFPYGKGAIEAERPIFAGENIGLNQFNPQLGPNSSRRAENIAVNPYAAAQYFHFIIDTILETLFGICQSGNRTISDVGMLGHVMGYFGVMEAQGRGMLHVHMLLWLMNTPNANEMQALLQQDSFRDTIRDYIHTNIRAHLDDLTEHNLKKMARDTQLAYSRPHDPHTPGWREQNHDFERHLCNNDLKINTNGADTKDVAFYITAYATKKQKKSHNLSVLMASALPYHINNPKYDDVHERNRLLIYHCINVINCEAELSAPQVVSYLMGYGDTFTSHNYASLYMGLLFSTIKGLYPEFSVGSTERYSYHLNGQGNDGVDGKENNDVVTLLAELEEFPLLTFVCDTWEERYTLTEEDQSQRTSHTRGRPAHMHSPYHEDHPKAQTHCRVRCAKGHNTLPQVVGPWLPHDDESSTYDFYCTCMLALLKLWQMGSDLKRSDEEWSDALERMKASNTPWVTHMLAGLQYYYDSKTACETASVPDHVDETANDTDDSGNWTATLSEVDLVAFKQDQLSAQEQAHAKQAIAIALQYGVFTACPPTQRPEKYSYQIAIGGDKPQLEAWLNTMHAMVDSVKENQISIMADKEMDQGGVLQNIGVTGPKAGGTYMLAQLVAVEDRLEPSAVDDLLEDQQ